MAWTLKVRGAHSQPMAIDFLCESCGPQSALADRDCDGVPCLDGCGRIAERVYSMPLVGAERASVDRGAVAKPRSPMFCDTRAIGEGQSIKDWKADRRKMYEQRRHAEGKNWK